MSVETFLGSAGLLFVGTITPGPNNLIVMHAAATQGWTAVTRLVVGIVLGGVVLLLPVAGGVASLVRSQPALALYIAVAGCIILIALGAGMIASARAERTMDTASAQRTARAWEVFTFQFLNPKAWVLVFTVTSATQSTYGTGAALSILLPLFIVIPTACLCLWSVLGLVMMRRLRRRSARRAFNMTMGALLCASAVLLLVEQVVGT